MLILNSNNLEIAQARENVSLKCLAERTGLCFGLYEMLNVVSLASRKPCIVLRKL